ncbi:hypothetical protein [Adhaeribacter pallidiroseus]|uniref:hypothetical protein n=1 Tax=Adhaeribacter pallidiroseus TaxID=2072847 RepID=UPI000E1BB884|nr:hypothetical protein [Adhaeribacter pallidiroseus]
MEVELKATNRIKKYRKVLPLEDIKGKAPSILFSEQLERLTNKWFAGKYEILLPDSTRSELTFKKDGFLTGYSNYNKYVLSSAESKDFLILSSNSKALPDMRCEMIQEADIIQLFELQPIEDVDDPLIRRGKSFALRKL